MQQEFTRRDEREDVMVEQAVISDKRWGRTKKHAEVAGGEVVGREQSTERNKDNGLG